MIKWEDHQGIIYSVAKRYRGRARSQGLDFKDLLQCGSLALLVAIREFKDIYGAKFATYAYICIDYAIKRELCLANPIRVPLNIDRDVCRLASGNGDSIKPVYRKCTAHAYEVLAAMKLSLDASVAAIPTNPDNDPFMIASHNDALDLLRMMINKLPIKEANVIRKRYPSQGESPRQEDVAISEGVTKAAVSHREINAIEKLKNLATKIKYD